MNNDNGALTTAHANGNSDALLQIKDLHVWYELKRLPLKSANDLICLLYTSDAADE